MSDISYRVRSAIRDVPDFPKPGILFKDITPVFLDPKLTADVTNALVSPWSAQRIDCVAGIESRGFLFGMSIAQLLDVPFILIRKAGKLPSYTFSHSYNLEYGTATVEVHDDAIQAGQNVLIHDDLLATGGTAVAGAELVSKAGGKTVGFSFLVELEFLKGRESLVNYGQVESLVLY